MPHPKGNLKLSGDVRLPADDDFDLATSTAGIDGMDAAAGDVLTAHDEAAGHVALASSPAGEAVATTPRKQQQRPPRVKAAPTQRAPGRMKAAAGRAGSSPYAFWAVSLLAVLAAVRMVR